MTTATLDHPVRAGSPHAVTRVALAVVFAVLLLVTFTIGRASAPDDAAPPAVPHAVEVDLGSQPFESCTVGPC